MQGETTKQALRAAFLARRRGIAAADAARWSAAIQTRVLLLPELQGVDPVYIYIATDNEPETRGLIEVLLAEGRRVLAPILAADRTFHWGSIRALADLRPGAHSIPQPPMITERATDPHRGVAIIPCVAFTAQGDRLGRGGGYYDRFLATFEGPTVALAYELQRAESLPVAAHDVRVYRIVTEATVYPA